MKPSPLVIVEWVDSACEQGWQGAKEAKRDAEDNDMRCETVGWLLDDADGYVLVATSRTVARGEKDLVCDLMQIPRVAVIAVRTLSVGRKR